MKLLGHALLAFVFVVALGASVVGAQTKIDKCARITESGPYVLSKNITASATDLVGFDVFGKPACIIIAANFVTLDLAGHVIAGPGPAEGDGIATDHCCSFQGTTVHSGVVTNFFNGVVLTSTGITIEHVQAIGNQLYGIRVFTSLGFFTAGHRIIGNTSLRNGIGIEIECPAVVLENVAAKNTQDVSYDNTGNGACTTLENSPTP